MEKNNLPNISVCIPVELRVQLEELAKQKEMTMNNVLIEALYHYIYRVVK